MEKNILIICYMNTCTNTATASPPSGRVSIVHNIPLHARGCQPQLALDSSNSRSNILYIWEGRVNIGSESRLLGISAVLLLIHKNEKKIIFACSCSSSLHLFSSETTPCGSWRHAVFYSCTRPVSPTFPSSLSASYKDDNGDGGAAKWEGNPYSYFT